MLRRRKRRTCPLAFCFFIGITLPYASILCTAVQVQNLSPAEKEVPPLEKLWTSPFVLFLREAIMLISAAGCPQAAACLAYFVLLTVFPVLICVSYILGMVNIDISLMDQLQPLLPEAARTCWRDTCATSPSTRPRASFWRGWRAVGSPRPPPSEPSPGHHRHV